MPSRVCALVLISHSGLRHERVNTVRPLFTFSLFLTVDLQMRCVGRSPLYHNMADSYQTEPALRLALLSEKAEQALAEGRLDDAIEMRQTCLALAQLACRDDAMQLARAATELAVAYLQAGYYGHAARQAAHADGMLVYEESPEPTLHAQALTTLARALADGREHAKALECFPRAIAQCERAFGRRHPSTCPVLRAFARLAAARGVPDFERASQLLDAERRIRVEQAGSVPPFAPEAARELTQLDQERAVVLLKHAKQLDRRAASGGGCRGGGGGGGRGGGRGGGGSRGAADRRPAAMANALAAHARKQVQPPTEGGRRRVGSTPGGSGGLAAAASAAASASASASAEKEMSASELAALATRKRHEATTMLREATAAARPSRASEGAAEEEAAARGSESGARAVPGGSAPLDSEEQEEAEAAQSEQEAQLAVQLAEAYVELEQWEPAEASYLRALPYFERERGYSDAHVVALWIEVASLRMRRREYASAARDHAHVLQMQTVLYGPRSAELIPTAERLCKAHVLLRSWKEARQALRLALQLSTARHGPEHRETARIADVLKSLDKYAGPEEVEVDDPII